MSRCCPECGRFARLRRAGLAVLLAAIAGALPVTLGTTVPARADPVRIETTRTRDTARIVFAWPGPIAFTSDVQDGRLLLRFERPVEADLRRLRGVRRFAGPAELQDDGRTLVLPLQKGVSGLAVPAGDRVVLELRHANARTAPPVTDTAEPADASETANAGASPQPVPVGVETGQHRGFSRVIFRWPERAGYTLQPADGRLGVQFDRRAAIDPRQFFRPYLRYLHGGSVEETEDGTRVILQIPQGASVRDVQEGRNLLLDVSPPPPSEASPSQASASPSPEDTSAGGTSAAVRSAPAAPEAEPDAGPPTEMVTEQARPAPSAPPPAPPPMASPAASVVGIAAAPAADPAAAAGVAGIRAGALQFTWDQPAAAALFQRGQATWCVFDRPLRADTLPGGPPGSAHAAALPPFLSSLQVLPHPDAAVLRLAPAPGHALRLEAAGNAWLLRPVAPTPAAEPVQPVPERAADGRTRLLLRTPEPPPPPLALHDPHVGDTLVVVPLRRAAAAAGAFESPRVRLLAASQGVTIQPLADGVRVRSTTAGVEIDHPLGLALWRPPAGASQGAAAPPEQRLGRVVAADAWLPVATAEVAQQRQALERALVDAAPGEREPHRLRLAQFLLGRNFAVEALGVLALAAEEQPALAGAPPFLFLRGGAALLAGKPVPALADLRRADDPKAAEAAMWIAAARTAAGEAQDGLHATEAWLPLLRSYPLPLRTALLPKLAEAAIAEGALDVAQRLLEEARPLARDATGDIRADSEAAAELGYLEGLRSQAAGDPAAALARWEEVANGDSRRGRAKAALARTLLLSGQGQMSVEDAITALDRLRFVWRGDETEFRVLHALGRLHLQAGDYTAALRMLRQAAGDFPGVPEVGAVAHEMARAFERLFLDGAADQLPPVTALALWEEFAELAPPGPKGAEMTRRMAERMVGLDLLDKAADLLEGLLAATGTPAERAALGARIAEIRVADRTPQPAIEALRSSAASGLPGDLQRRRGLVQAQALLALDRAGEAAAALAGDASIEAELLRAQAARARKDWGEAAGALQRILAAHGADGAASLDDAQARQVLELAVALTLAGSDPQLAELDDRYRGAMAETPLRDTFRLIAGTAPPPTADPAALQELVEKAIAYRRTLAPGDATPANAAPSR